jgi:Protein of unknown function (DUF1236)
MRTRLFLSAAVATLSLCLAPVHAQNNPREKGGEAAKQSEKQSESSARPTTRPDDQRQGATPQHERKGARAGNHDRGEARGAGKEAKPGESAEKSDMNGHHAGTKKHEKHGAIDEPQGRPGEQGANGPDGSRGAGQETTPDVTKPGAPGFREQTGEARPGAENRTGGGGAVDERRTGRSETEGGERAGAPERRGEAGMGPDQRNPGAVERGEPGASPRGREAFENQAGRVRLGARQRGQIRQIIEQRGGQRLSPDAFDLRVGVIAPPNVVFAPLPPDVIALAPQFAGDSYALVGDDIAIIDPSSREIVTVLDERGPPPAIYGYEERDDYRGGYQGRERRGEGERGLRREQRGEVYGYAPRVRLDTRQERALYRGIMSEARQNLRQVCVRVGERVPESVDIEPVPRSIAAEAPDVERFEYFVLNDQVVLVDPDTRIVADIIPAPR